MDGEDNLSMSFVNEHNDNTDYTEEDSLSRIGLKEEMKDPSLVQEIEIILGIRGKDLLLAPDEEG